MGWSYRLGIDRRLRRAAAGAALGSGHSHLSDAIGSTREARLAGSQHATADTDATDRILRAELLFRQRLAYEHDPGGIRSITLVQKPAAPERDTHGLEIAGGDHIAEHAIGLVVLLEPRPIDAELCVIRQGQEARERCGGNSRNAAHFFERLREKSPPVVRIVKLVPK